MAEHPLLFTTEMVRAILDDRKTQTRRVPVERYRKWKVGDKIYVRETFWQKGYWETDKSFKKHWIPWQPEEKIDFYYDADGEPEGIRGSYTPFGSCIYLLKRPSIHMPKWAARIWLEITGLREEYAHLITDADVLAEGVEQRHIDKNRPFFHPHDVHGLAFGELWDSINAKRHNGIYAWDKNPLVKVIEFKRIKDNG